MRGPTGGRPSIGPPATQKDWGTAVGRTIPVGRPAGATAPARVRRAATSTGPAARDQPARPGRAVGRRVARSAFSPRGAQALIAVLALKPRIRTREAVAAEIWPDGDGSGTSASLRQALWLVRSSFAAAAIPLEPYLIIDAEVIGFQPCAPIDLDVARFEPRCAVRRRRPEEAIALVPRRPRRVPRARVLRRRAGATVGRLRGRPRARRRAPPRGRRTVRRARDAAERLLARDPLREEAHATLLRVYGRIGSRAQVLRQYRRLVAPPRTASSGWSRCPRRRRRSGRRWSRRSSGRGCGRPGWPMSPRRALLQRDPARRAVPAATHR